MPAATVRPLGARHPLIPVRDGSVTGSWRLARAAGGAVRGENQTPPAVGRIRRKPSATSRLMPVGFVIRRRL
jgi:hypothetical protein